MINSGFFDPRSNDPMLCRDSLAVGIGAFSFKADGVEILVSRPSTLEYRFGLC